MSQGEGSGVSDFGVSNLGEAVRSARAGEEQDGLETFVDPRFALADAVRRITTAMVGRPIADDVLSAATADAAALADRLEEQAGPGRRLRRQPDPAGHAQDFFPTSPIIGFANPVAPPVYVEAVDGAIEGTAFFDYQYEGPPNCVHGGVIAMVFDEILGAASIVAGNPGMTGTLTVRYRKPTPLRTPLRLRAEMAGRSGRKITIVGSMYRDDELLAEAEGLFIEVFPARFIQIVTAEAGSVDSPELAQQLGMDIGPPGEDPSDRS